MKTMRKILALLFVVSLLLSLGLTAAFAADEETETIERTYTVRIFAGNQGKLNIGSDPAVFVGTYGVGAQVSFSPDNVDLPEDSKYYVKGIREAGLDNDAIAYSSFTVTRDIDYVVAYGILSTAVQYTVNYVSTKGETLAPSKTFYGNVGDKPVVAHIYVEKYIPQAYNLTMTLSENAAANVFTFVYSPIPTVTVTTPVTTPTPATGTHTAAGGTTPQAQSTPKPQTTESPSASAEDKVETAPAELEAPAEPVEILDLDVPAGAPEPAAAAPAASETSSEPARKGSNALKIALGVTGGAAAVAGAWFAVAKRKKAG